MQYVRGGGVAEDDPGSARSQTNDRSLQVALVVERESAGGIGREARGGAQRRIRRIEVIEVALVRIWRQCIECAYVEADARSSEDRGHELQIVAVANMRIRVAPDWHIELSP